MTINANPIITEVEKDNRKLYFFWYFQSCSLTVKPQQERQKLIWMMKVPQVQITSENNLVGLE